MAKHHNIGKKGEELALNFLQNKGLEILEKNWRFKKAEIDIIAKNPTENILIFVEVKTRTSDFFGTPESFVTPQKEKLMADAAQVYAQEIQHDWEIRFDIIAVLFQKKHPQISHFEDAFFPSDF